MRRDFILVGLLVGLFVFPYVLTIEESSAEGLGCPNSLGIGEKIRCLESTLREQNVKVRNLEKSIAESGQARFVLSSQLNDCRMDSPSTNLGPRSSNAIPVFWGKPAQNTDCKSRWNSSTSKKKINANVNNAKRQVGQIYKVPYKQWIHGPRTNELNQLLGNIEDNLEAVATCANAYPSGC